MEHSEDDTARNEHATRHLQRDGREDAASMRLSGPGRLRLTKTACGGVLWGEQAIMASKTIIWNGPMGVFEMKSFETGAFGLGSLVPLV
jgi:hypothetical protein